MSCSATWIDPESIILSQVRERQTSYGIAYSWNIFKIQICLFANRNRLMYLEKRLMVSRSRGEGWGEGIYWEFGIDMYIVLYLKYITNKGLLYSTGELCSILCNNLNVKRIWNRYIYNNWITLVYTWNTTLINYTSI